MDYFGIDAKYVKYLANKTAREHGFNKATLIEFKNCIKPKVRKAIKFGYRKCTTGEYVPNAYITKFGWKNTFYQSAVCIVTLPMRYKAIAKRR